MAHQLLRQNVRNVDVGHDGKKEKFRCAALRSAALTLTGAKKQQCDSLCCHIADSTGLSEETRRTQRPACPLMAHLFTFITGKNLALLP